MRLLAPEPEALDAVARRAYPETPGLVAPFSAWMPAGDLLGAKATELPYPLIVKLARGLYRRADGPEELAAFLRELGGEKHPEVEVYVQGFVPGEVARMASAIVLCDADGRAVRVFTARRLRVAPTAYGWFGETLAARSPSSSAGAASSRWRPSRGRMDAGTCSRSTRASPAGARSPRRTARGCCAPITCSARRRPGSRGRRCNAIAPNTCA